ncbi:MAG: putative toxin-antitoxin system toxin component, PIN family [Solirubrobacterales bacterium]
MNLRVACDTNVLVSAFISRGPPNRVIEEVAEGSLDLVLLEPTISELKRVLTQKFGFESNHVDEALSVLQDLAIDGQPTTRHPDEPLTGDPDDDLILQCAVDARVQVLVSGDRRHLLPLGEHGGVRILTPQGLLKELRAI